MNIEREDEIVRAAFGQWVSGLFAAVCGWNPNSTFQEQKEAFFMLLEKMLKNGKVMFIVPGTDCYVSPENPLPNYL